MNLPTARIRSLALVLGAALGLAACGTASVGPTAAPKVGGTSSSSPTSTSTTTQQPALTVSTTEAATDSGTSGLRTCTTAQLTVALRANVSGGLSYAGDNLVFTDKGGPCELYGYPGVDGLSASGKVVFSATRTLNGYLGGVVGGSPTTVRLHKGQSASALLEGIDGPITAVKACPSYTALLVTPPNDTKSVRLASGYNLCNLQIHPVVAGTEGGAKTPDPAG